MIATQKSALSEAIEEFPVVEYLSRYAKVQYAGEFVRLNCPNCRGRNTLSVNVRTKASVCFRCYDGGYGGATWSGKGSLVDIICLFDGVDRRQAISTIYELSGLPDSYTPRQIAPDGPQSIPEEAMTLDRVGWNHPSRALLRNRGLDHLDSRIYACLTGAYCNRWILPIWQFGQFAGFEAKSFMHQRPPSRLPAGIKTVIYTTPMWDWTCDFCVVTESIFDAETLGVNAVGLFGSNVSDSQFCRLWELRRSGIKKLVWALDEDAWNKQSRFILRKTRCWYQNYVLVIPTGHDPNSLGRKACWELVRKAISVSSSFDLARSRHCGDLQFT